MLRTKYLATLNLHAHGVAELFNNVQLFNLVLRSTILSDPAAPRQLFSRCYIKWILLTLYAFVLLFWGRESEAFWFILSLAQGL